MISGKLKVTQVFLDGTQEKIFEDKLEISAVDPDIWYPRFLSCCDLLTLPSLVRSAGVEKI